MITISDHTKKNYIIDFFFVFWVSIFDVHSRACINIHLSWCEIRIFLGIKIEKIVRTCLYLTAILRKYIMLSLLQLYNMKYTQ